MIGGLRGLLLLYRNMQAMLELTVYAENWTGNIGGLFSELVRQDAVNLRQATMKLCLTYLLCRTSKTTGQAVQSVLRVYEGGAFRVATLYETTHKGLAPQLTSAIGVC